jgi:hypothetical protein
MLCSSTATIYRIGVTNIDFENIDSIQSYGFVGFITIAELQTTSCSDVPDEPGVYLVIRKDHHPPKFLHRSRGGHFKGKNPTVSTTKLQSKWVAGPKVIYIGKAGGPRKSATLKSRLLQYMQFGCGRRVGHWGGRYIWQLDGVGDLEVCWKPILDENSAVVESRLIQEFKTKYGKNQRPFANLRN